jgi:hypothetical protein
MFAIGISRAKQGTLDIVNHLGAKALAENRPRGDGGGDRQRSLSWTAKRIRDLPITPDKLLA